MSRLLVAIGISVVLAGCNSANSRISTVNVGSAKGIVTSGNLRLVTERHKAGYPPVLCSEPSPDYMVAFGSTQKVTGSSPAGTGNRSLDINLTTTEQVSEGKGREAAVLALRDGLYVACQSYANGVIGQDAYAVILSQYGNLLVALVGNDTAAANVQVSGPQAALSAMTVACISGHDRSRDDNHGNSLLNDAFCQRLLDRVVERGIRPPAPAGATRAATGPSSSPRQTAAAAPSRAPSGAATTGAPSPTTK